MQTILIRRDKADAVRNSYAREGKKEEKKTKKMSSSLAFDVFGKHWTTKALHFENYCLNFLHAILPILGQKIEIVDAKTRQVLGGVVVDNVTVQYKPLQLSITLYHNPQDYKLSIQDTREYRKKWKRVIAKGQTFPQNLQEEIQLFCSVLVREKNPILVLDLVTTPLSSPYHNKRVHVLWRGGAPWGTETWKLDSAEELSSLMTQLRASQILA